MRQLELGRHERFQSIDLHDVAIYSDLIGFLGGGILTGVNMMIMIETAREFGSPQEMSLPALVLGATLFGVLINFIQIALQVI